MRNLIFALLIAICGVGQAQLTINNLQGDVIVENTADGTTVINGVSYEGILDDGIEIVNPERGTINISVDPAADDRFTWWRINSFTGNVPMVGSVTHGSFNRHPDTAPGERFFVEFYGHTRIEFSDLNLDNKITSDNGGVVIPGWSFNLNRPILNIDLNQGREFGRWRFFRGNTEIQSPYGFEQSYVPILRDIRYISNGNWTSDLFDRNDWSVRGETTGSKWTQLRGSNFLGWYRHVVYHYDLNHDEITNARSSFNAARQRAMDLGLDALSIQYATRHIRYVPLGNSLCGQIHREDSDIALIHPSPAGNCPSLSDLSDVTSHEVGHLLHETLTNDQKRRITELYNRRVNVERNFRYSSGGTNILSYASTNEYEFYAELVRFWQAGEDSVRRNFLNADHELVALMNQTLGVTE